MTRLLFFFRALRHASATQWGQALVLFVSLLLYSTTGYMYFELPANPDLGWTDAFWWAIVTMTTVGYGDFFPGSTAGRLLVGLPTMVIGVGMLGYMLSILAAAMIESKMRENRGMEAIKSRDHIVICTFGALERTLEVVQEIRKDPSTRETCIVLVDDALEELPAELVAEKVRFVKGDPSREAVLEQANITAARAAIIQADAGDAANSDNRNLRIALTVESVSPETYTVVECIHPDNAVYFRRASCDSVVCVARLSGQMIVQELQDPGVASIVAELTSNVHGKQFYLVDIRFACERYADVRDHFLQGGACPLGIRRDEENFLLPGPDFEVRSGDRAILVSSERPG